MRKLAWQGTVAVDLLQKLVHEYRPYEVNRGQTDQVYQRCLGKILEAVREGGGGAVVKAMRWVATQFEALPADRSQPRPVIGLVGEIYLRLNAFGNQNIIRQVESAGGEVMVATMMEWLYFTNWYYKRMSRTLGNYFDFLTTFIVDAYQRDRERKLVKPVEHLLRFPHESPIELLIEHIQPYYEPYLATEAILSMGKAVDFARLGLSGILNVMPFSCMPGIITAGMAPRLRHDLNNIPWLDVIYDAQGGTNLNTRLEAFMFQAKQYQRSS
jgi:predicted nucleotide-binding protein (sugar kinase/HSP70/actin superfamily)